MIRGIAYIIAFKLTSGQIEIHPTPHMLKAWGLAIVYENPMIEHEQTMYSYYTPNMILPWKLNEVNKYKIIDSIPRFAIVHVKKENT
ncbi:MAG: hypothetical protein ACTSQF_01985 [Candidatus Heimdallarchaeaceae archaeon]